MEKQQIDRTSDEHFMREALREANRAVTKEEVPVGVVIVRNGCVIARAYNQVEILKDATAHAEILAITQASQVVGDWRLEGCAMFVTKEPCLMCAGAIVHARLERIVYGAKDSKAGGAGGLFNVLSHPSLNHCVEIIGGVLQVECSSLLKNFFLGKRKVPSDSRERKSTLDL